MPGPLPAPAGERRRRNAPTVPTTKLPASGRQEPAPKLPPGKTLGKAGRAWWRWAWATPQACAWDDGALQFVYRRAALEDDLESLAELGGNGLDFAALIGLAGRDHLDALKELRFLIRNLQALAGDKLKITREMRELDDRLGLTPKSLAQLRWSIYDDSEEAVEQSTPEVPADVPKLSDRRARLVADAP